MAGFVGYYGDMVNGMPTPLTQAPGKRYPDTLIGQTDVAPLLNLLSELPHGAPIAVDTETTGLFPYEDDVIRGVSIAFRTPPGYFQTNPAPGYGDISIINNFYIPVGYPNASDNLSTQSQQMIFQAVKDLDPFLILHHGKFDFAFLRQLPMTKDGGVYFPVPLASPPQAAPSWWDTKVVAWLLDENMPTGLKEQAAFHFGEDSKDEQKAIKKLVREKGWDGLTPEDTAEYAAKDADLTYRLYERQQELIDHPSTLGDIRPAIARELAIQGVLGRMEAAGILVNPELLEKMTAEAVWAVAECEEEFAAQSRGVNMNSPKQLAAYIYDVLEIPGKNRSTARDVLESLNPPGPGGQLALDCILKHRRLKKALTGYLVPLRNRMGRDGRIHAHFNSTGTVTGRPASSAPNLQTIPRADTLVGVRDLFIAEPGFELFEYDLNSAEKRVMAGMADERVLIDALNDGTDVHAALAEQVFGAKWTPIQRRYAKNIGYGFDYGLTSVTTAAKYIKGNDGEAIAKKILAGLRKMYPNIVALMNRTTREAEKRGYVPIHDDPDVWPGRYRRFRTPSVRRSPAYTALNAKIQGGIAEFLKDVMLEAEPLIDATGARICLAVHDSLVIEVPEGAGEKVREILQQVADKVNPFAMPMIFDASPWAAHE